MSESNTLLDLGDDPPVTSPDGSGSSSDLVSPNADPFSNSQPPNDPFGETAAKDPFDPFTTQFDQFENQSFAKGDAKTFDDQFDPFATIQSPSSPDKTMNDQALSDTEKQDYEAQFADLLGDFSGGNPENLNNGTVTVEHTTVDSGPGGETVTTTTKTTVIEGETESLITHTDQEQQSFEKKQDSQSNKSESGGDEKEKKGVDYIKERYTGEKPEQPHISLRNPKKLDVNWEKQVESLQEARTIEKDPKDLQELVASDSVGTCSPLSPVSPGTPDPNRTPVNRQQVEKVAPPQITQNLRALFEANNLPDKHQVTKSQIDIPKPTEDESTCVAENEPVRLEGVCRESDKTMEGETVTLGSTKKLTSQFKNKKDAPTKKKGPINVAEDEGKVLENEPVQRDDVIRETDESDEYLPSRGYTMKFAQKFQMSQDEQPTTRRRVIKLVDDDNVQPTVLENEPEAPSEGVVRSGERTEDDVQFEEGRTTKLAGMWQNRKEDGPRKRQPIVINREENGAVLENEPEEQREGVIRGGDVPDSDKDMELSSGRTRAFASMFQNAPEDDLPARKQPLKLDYAEDGPTVWESEPEVRGDDVVRGDVVTRQEEFNVLKRGAANKLKKRWQKNEEVAAETHTSTHGSKGKPAWILEIEAAREMGGVYENEPDAPRDDVSREDDLYEPEQDVIPERTLKNMRAMWANREAEEDSKSPQINSPEVNKPRRRKVLPAPEVEAPEEPHEKPRRGRALRGRGAKPVEPEPEPEPVPKPGRRRGAKPAPKPEPEPEPVVTQKSAPFGAFKLKTVKKKQARK